VNKEYRGHGVLFHWLQDSSDDLDSGRLKLVIDHRIEIPTWKTIGREWIRQELKRREEEKAERKRIGREWIRQELEARENDSAIEANTGTGCSKNSPPMRYAEYPLQYNR